MEKLNGIHQHNVLSDPIQFPKQYSSKQDQEIVALISALYAFGNVKMIFNTIRNILQFLGESPCVKIQNLTSKDLNEFSFVTHRWIKPNDTRFFLRLISEIIQKEGTLESSFQRLYQPLDETLEASMIAWMKHLQDTMISIQELPLTRGQKFLLSAPGKSSTSKRLLMFFRWMVRSEDPDLGLWKSISPSQLLMPLDAHLFRFSHYLGFIKKKQTGWKAVTLTTQHFRKICPEDPIKYDFALARLGILDLCLHRVSSLCESCEIQIHCKLYRQKKRK